LGRSQSYRQPVRSARARKRTGSINDELKHLEEAAKAVQLHQNGQKRHGEGGSAGGKVQQQVVGGPAQRRDRSGSIGDELQMLQALTAEQAAQLAAGELDEEESSPPDSPRDGSAVHAPPLEEQPEGFDVATTSVHAVARLAGRLKSRAQTGVVVGGGLRLELPEGVEDDSPSGSLPPTPPTPAKVEAARVSSRGSRRPPPLPSGGLESGGRSPAGTVLWTVPRATAIIRGPDDGRGRASPSVPIDIAADLETLASLGA
jgi:hypothetical protein